MDYFYDTEFIAYRNRLYLISVGIVGDDGSEYYAENKDINRWSFDRWTHTNILPLLDVPEKAKPESVIAKEIVSFVKPDNLSLWAYGGAYDHVIITQLLKSHKVIPEYWPYHTNELIQLKEEIEAAQETKLILPNTNPKMHHALHDARWSRDVFHFLMAEYGTTLTRKINQFKVETNER